MAFQDVGVRAQVKGVSSYVRDANRVEKATTGMSNRVKNVAPSFRVSTTQALRFGAALFGVQLGISVMSRTLVGLQKSTIGAAIAFESSFAGIRKTMDLTEEQFDALARANRDLAKEIPVTANELNKIGELAGQLGIRGVENVVKFEETIAQLAVTTDLTAESAAISLAQIANILQIPQDDVDRLGSSIVGLGNNFATTESRIVDFGLRIAGAGKIAGLTAGEVFGIGTAFASVGVQAERGGTAIQQSLIAMQKAVVEGGTELEIFAAVAGVTSEEFATLFRDDAAQAFTLFVEGLGLAGEQGFEILDALGLEGQRLIGSFLSVAGAGDTLRDAIEQGNFEFARNVALQDEAAQRFATTASKLQILRNGFADIGISAGDALVDGLLPLLEATQEWIDTNGDEFAIDLANAIEGGIGFAAELAEEIGNLAAFLQQIADIGVVKIALDVAELAGADKITLTLAAAAIGFLTAGPAGALVLGGTTLAGLTLADFFGFGEREADLSLNELLEQRTEAIRIRQEIIGDVGAIIGFFGEDSSQFEQQVKLIEAAVDRVDELNAKIRAATFISAERAEGFISPGFLDPGAAPFRAAPGDRPPIVLPPSDEEVARARKALDKLIRDAERARDRIMRESLAEVDLLGNLIVSALRAQAQTTLDIALDEIDDEREARQDALRDRLDEIDDERDAAIDAINDRRDARLKAIEDETEAREGQIDAELAGLQQEADADELRQLERDLALAFEEDDVFEAQQRIAEFRRRQRSDELRDERRDIRDAARDAQQDARDTARDELEAARDLRDDLVDLARDEFEADIKLLDARGDAARDTFEGITEDWRLQAEARRLILEGENAEIARLLAAQGDEWRTAGISLGEQLVNGIRSQLDPFITSAFAGIPGSAEATEFEANRAASIAVLQQRGKDFKAGGAPNVALEATRRSLIDLFGAVPQFPHGGFVGGGGSRVPIEVEPGELVLNPVQQQALLGGRTIFEAGAFDGMFRESVFDGSPEENGRAIARQFEALMDDTLGRGAFLRGVGN